MDLLNGIKLMYNKCMAPDGIFSRVEMCSGIPGLESWCFERAIGSSSTLIIKVNELNLYLLCIRLVINIVVADRNFDKHQDLTR